MAIGVNWKKIARFNNLKYLFRIYQNSQAFLKRIGKAGPLDNLNLVIVVIVVWFLAGANLDIAPAASKNGSRFKSGQKRLENSHII